MSSRRSFLKTFSAAVTALPLAQRLSAAPPLGLLAGWGAQPERPFGFAAVGLGRISVNEFMPGVKNSQKVRIVALVSGHRPKAERIADQYGVDHAHIYNYENFDRIIDNPAIDAVYLGLPNSMHAEYTMRAARAGKHVLCEKPMAISTEECQQMIAACRRAGRKLMIAYRCQYEPVNLKAIELVRQGRIGTLEMIESSFGFGISPMVEVVGERVPEWRLKRSMSGGGPMLDVGIYSLNACRHLVGEEPIEVQATTSTIDHDGRFTSVEENEAWTMKFPSGVLTSCTTSYGYKWTSGNWYRVMGKQGVIHSSPAFTYNDLALHAEVNNGPDIDFKAPYTGPWQFQNEAEYFADCVRQNREPKTNGEEGLQDLRIITACYDSARSGRPVRLPAAVAARA